MCGFVGLLDIRGRAADAEALRPALDALAHRGPDAEGMWSEGPIALGHRRLSILDTSAAGTQPMHAAGGDLTVAFNGEIYNFLELRAELERLGHAFHTETDTEVVLHAWLAWGEECFARFNGMWAMALWDRRAQKLVLSRDRFGIKPLYLGLVDGRWVFGSELQALARLDPRGPRINRALALDFLADALLDHTEGTAMEGWERVEPGEFLVLEPRAGAAARHRHYDYRQAGDPERRARIRRDRSGRALRELQDDLKAALRDAVELRMRADVPTALSLSGGVDSGSIACFVADIGNARRSSMVPLGFYARTKGADELRYVQAVAEKARLEIDVTALDHLEMGDTLQQVFERHDEPLHSLMPIAGYLICRSARRRGITVLLNGQGADEQTAGYDSTIPAFLAEVLRARGPLAAHAQWRAEGGGRSRLLAALRASGGGAVADVARIGRALGLTGRGGLASRSLHDEVGRGRWLLGHAAPVGLRAQLDHSVMHAPLPLYLRIEDRNSMAHGREARLPFLDFNVVALFSTIPAEHMRRDGYNKSALREAVRGVLPEVVRTRQDKMGFPVPEADWIRGPFRDWFADVTDPASLRRRGLYDTQAVIEARRAFLDGQGPLNRSLHRVFLFESWARTHIDR